MCPLALESAGERYSQRAGIHDEIPMCICRASFSSHCAVIVIVLPVAQASKRTDANESLGHVGHAKIKVTNGMQRHPHNWWR